MERPRGSLLLLILIPVFFSIFINGCKKDEEFDPADAVLSDFKGTWRGTISMFKGATWIEKNGDIILYYSPDGTMLHGMMTFGQVYEIQQIQFSNGVFYFEILNSDTLNPLCNDWNLSGFMRLIDHQKAEVYISGKECGLTGQNWVSFQGTLILVNPEPDPATYYSFAKSGNQWDYKVTQVNGDTCHLQYVINTDLGNYYFEGQESNSCNWNWNSSPLQWRVMPFQFSVLSDTTATILYTFYLDAHLNSDYFFISGADTSIVTLLASGESIVVPAGTFSCAKFRVEQRIHTNGYSVESGIWWLNNSAGLVKSQSITAMDSTDLKYQELNFKNF